MEMLIKWILYEVVALIAVIDLVVLVKLIEYSTCVLIMHQPPFVPSNKRLRAAVVQEVHDHYPDARRITEVGSGYGGLVRALAAACPRAHVYGIENMPVAAWVSKIAALGRPNVHTVHRDAFAYLDGGARFDVAVAYLGPDLTPRLADYAKNFPVLISCDFEIPNRRPTRVIDVGGGYTRYRGKKYPHRIYVYEF